jgi:hypothetical protein
MSDQDLPRDDGFREHADALARLVPQTDDPEEHERTEQMLLDNIERMYSRAGVQPPAWMAGLRADRK